jgi:hypothetical protein
MELGSYTVYYVQYRSAGGHWVTKQPAWARLEQAEEAEVDFREVSGYTETRVVRQTTENVLASNQ